MVHLILISHGSLAAGMREAAEMILGKQDDLEVFGLYQGDTVESFSQKIEAVIEDFGNPNNTLIVSDLPSGTPANSAMLMVLKHKVHAISGCNLPTFLEILSLRDDETDILQLIDSALEVGKAGIVSARNIIEERRESP